MAFTAVEAAAEPRSVCVARVKPLFPPVDIQHTHPSCARSDYSSYTEMLSLRYKK